jgi:hypothetical protein
MVHSYFIGGRQYGKVRRRERRVRERESEVEYISGGSSFQKLF